MRSLRYVVSGVPRKVDDCLDLARRCRPKTVVLSLETSESVTELYLLKSFVAVFTWVFDDEGTSEIVIEECLGCCFSHESEERQRKAVDRANKKLEAVLGVLAGGKDLHVEGSENRFDYSLVYSKEAV